MDVVIQSTERREKEKPSFMGKDVYKTSVIARAETIFSSSSSSSSSAMIMSMLMLMEMML